MPELPEVQTVCLQLRRGLVGQRVEGVDVQRPPVVRLAGAQKQHQAALLAGQTVHAVLRHGKQLALVGAKGAVVVVHLGMSGQLRLVGPDHRSGPATALTASAVSADPPKHTHVRWRLGHGNELWFTDPRRFGGIWCYDQTADLHTQRWSALGPDAVDPALGPNWRPFWQRLKRSTRPIKTALLDQAVIAGVGNIYADEALFRAGIRPQRRCQRLTASECRRLLEALQGVLTAAIEAGGSTLRDYVQTSGAAGGFQKQHLVYGRGGRGCPRCAHRLKQIQLGQRTTVFCPGCQR